MFRTPRLRKKRNRYVARSWRVYNESDDKRADSADIVRVSPRGRVLMARLRFKVSRGCSGCQGWSKRDDKVALGARLNQL